MTPKQKNTTTPQPQDYHTPLEEKEMINHQ
ncbi:hypothetical protein A2U01_0112820, partial [Trifolium medium]|nr:hypothetical protein [Trifolium medium]